MFEVINLQTGEFYTVTLDEAALLAELDPAEIEWAIKERGFCETATHQIIKIDSLPEVGGLAGDGGDASDGEFASPLPVYILLSREEFEARLSGRGAPIRLGQRA